MRKKNRKISVSGLLQASAFLTIVFSVATGLDIPHRNIELFSHFRLQYFVVSALLLLSFAFMKRPLIAAALLLTTVFNGSFIVGWYLPAAEKANSPANLKLVHANVYSLNEDYWRLDELIAAEDPDVFILQEITAEWVLATKKQLADYPYVYAEPRLGHFGIAAFSKIPFDSIRHIDLPPRGYPTIFATITVDDKPVTIVSTHPTVPLGEYLYESRNEQLESVAAAIQKIDGSVVLMGDFNASIWDTRYQELEQKTGLKNVRRGFGVLPTWPTFLPFAMIPIDHALVSADITVTDAKVGQSIGSDHLPLVVTLSL